MRLLCQVQNKVLLDQVTEQTQSNMEYISSTRCLRNSKHRVEVRYLWYSYFSKKKGPDLIGEDLKLFNN